MIPDRSEAEKFFSPHYARFATALLEGNGEYEGVDAGLRAKQTSRSKSSTINDLIIHRAQVEFDPVSLWVKKYGAMQLILDNAYRIKFKKLAWNLRPMNVPTQTVMEFLFQIQQILPHTPDPLINVVAGYVLNKAGVIDGTFIVCPNGRRNAWTIPLPMDAAPGQITMLRPAALDQGPQPQRRILPKATEETASDQS